MAFRRTEASRLGGERRNSRMKEPEKRVYGPKMTASLPVGRVEDEGAMVLV